MRFERRRACRLPVVLMRVAATLSRSREPMSIRPFISHIVTRRHDTTRHDEGRPRR